jgi:hypothetical protein
MDDFCQTFLPAWHKHLLASGRSRIKPARLTPSEVMTIQVLFHLSGIRTFKKFYTGYVQKHLRAYFPNLVSYNRMVELSSQMIVPLAIYLKTQATGECTGISFIDSTPLRVCHNRRIHSHKVFKDMAKRGHCSVGWFYGFKLHLVLSDTGDIINFMLTPGNTDDRTPLKNEAFVRKLFGKLFGDKGYISKDLFQHLFAEGIHLITKLRKNMKTKLVTPMRDAILLRKRAICETIIDQLKNIFQIEHSRHRSPKNFLTNLFSALIAYSFTEKKPSLNYTFVKTKQLCLF